jgi:hypothetical protein
MIWHAQKEPGSESKRLSDEKYQIQPMMPCPTIRLLRPSKIDTVRPTTPSPPTPRLSLTSPVFEVVTVSTKKECKIGLDEQAASFSSDSESESESDQGFVVGDMDNGCPYLLNDKTKGRQHMLMLKLKAVPPQEKGPRPIIEQCEAPLTAVLLDSTRYGRVLTESSRSKTMSVFCHHHHHRHCCPRRIRSLMSWLQVFGSITLTAHGMPIGIVSGHG